MRGRTAGGRGRPQEPGASENLVRGLEAPFSGPEDWLPASDFCTGSSPPRRNDVSERPRPQPPRPPAPPHEPSPVTARGSARRSRAPGQRRVSCPNFHAAAASQRASTTFVLARKPRTARDICPRNRLAPGVGRPRGDGAGGPQTVRAARAGVAILTDPVGTVLARDALWCRCRMPMPRGPAPRGRRSCPSSTCTWESPELWRSARRARTACGPGLCWSGSSFPLGESGRQVMTCHLPECEPAG